VASGSYKDVVVAVADDVAVAVVAAAVGPCKNATLKQVQQPATSAANANECVLVCVVGLFKQQQQQQRQQRQQQHEVINNHNSSNIMSHWSRAKR